MRRFTAPVLALALMLTMAAPAAAYELAPSGKFEESAISDGVLSICYGTVSTDSIYTQRGNLAKFLNSTWGAHGLDFVSNGLCNNDGSNIQVIYDWSMSCTDAFGRVWLWYGDWVSRTIDINPCRINAGQADFSSNGPNGGWGESTDANKYSMQQLVAHEVGHTLGLGHSSVRTSIVAGDPTCFWGASQGLDRDDTLALRDEYNDGGYTFVHGVSILSGAATCWG